MPLSREQLVTGGWYDNAGGKDKYARCRYGVMSLCNLLHEYYDIRWRTKSQDYSELVFVIEDVWGGKRCID